MKFASKTPAASQVLNIADRLCGLLTSSTKTVKFFILQSKTLLIRSNLLGKIDIYNFFQIFPNYIQKIKFINKYIFNLYIQKKLINY